MAPEGVAVETYDLPHDQGPGHVLHLQSLISAITDEGADTLHRVLHRQAAGRGAGSVVTVEAAREGVTAEVDDLPAEAIERRRVSSQVRAL